MSGEEWHKQYLNEMGKRPSHVDQLIAYSRNRGGALTFSDAKAVVTCSDSRAEATYVVTLASPKRLEIVPELAAADCRNASLVGALVADAATMPLHWLYDIAQIREIVGDADPLFFRTPSSPYYNCHDFPGHYKAGMLSPHGEQTFATYQMATRVLPSASKGRLESALDATKFGAAYHEWAKEYTGRAGGMLQKFLTKADASSRGGGLAKREDAKDDQSQCFGMVPSIVALVGPSEYLLASVEVAVRTLQNDDFDLAVALFWGVVLQAIVVGRSIKDAVEEGKAKKYGGERLKRAIDEVEANLASSTHSLLLAHGEEQRPGFPTSGLTARNPGAFMGCLHVILKARSFAEGVKANLFLGGDNCSRAIIVGAVLGAAYGIPEIYFDKLDQIVHSELKQGGVLSNSIFLRHPESVVF